MPTQQETEVLVNEIQPGKIYQVKDSDGRTLSIDNKGRADWYWARLMRNPAGDHIARVSFEARPGGKFRMKQHMLHPDNRGLMLFTKTAANDTTLCFAILEYEKDHFHIDLTPEKSDGYLTFKTKLNDREFHLCYKSTDDNTELVISTDSARQVRVKLHQTS